MKVLVTLIIVLISWINSWTQHISYYAKLNTIKAFNNSIKDGLSWDTLLYQIKNDSLLLQYDFADDVKKTISFLDEVESYDHPLDIFFYDLCDTTFDIFPYRISGHIPSYIFTNIADLRQRKYELLRLKNNLSSFPPPPPPPLSGKSAYPKIIQFVNSDSRFIIPELINHLSNDAATRCVIDDREADEASFYLSISDVAMEMLEIITLCDFYDNASVSYQLFSNENSEFKALKIKEISSWWQLNKNKSKVESAISFIESIPWQFNHSSVFTYKNLLSYGDTLHAKYYLKRYYEYSTCQCNKDFNTGRILQNLGDDILLQDCLRDLNQYNCYNSLPCVQHILQNASSFYVLAEIVATERYSINKRYNKNFIWHAIFNEMVHNKDVRIKPILLELLRITDSVEDIDIFRWKNKYPVYYEANFRVCDFALLKLQELFPKSVGSIKWQTFELLEKRRNEIIENSRYF